MASRHTIVLATAGLLVAAPLSAQRAQVTLAEAITMAEQAQPRMVQALGQVRSTGTRVRTARGAYLPNLNFSAGGSSSFSESQRVNSTTGEIESGGSRSQSISTQLSTSIEVFDGFRRGNDLAVARANEAAADAGLVDARFQQALQTTNQFLDALASRRLLIVREASVRRAEEQLKTSVARLQAGAATRSDSLRSLVGVGNAQLQLLTTQAQLATAEANLGRLIGQSERVAATDDSAFYRIVTAIDTAVLRGEAVARSPQVLSAEAAVRASEAGLRASRSDYWPSLNLSASYGLNGSSSNDYTLLSRNSVGLSLSWPLFNRFGREQNVTLQAIAVDNARASAEEMRRLIVANMTTQLANLEAARLRIEISGRSVEAAQEDLRVQQERYRLGASTILDVLTTQEQLTQAEIDAVNAWFDYLRAKAQIEALIGRSL